MEDGSRCTAYKQNGSDGCYLHGKKIIPATKKAARLSLDLLRDMSIDRLYEILQLSNDEKLVAKVGLAVLDRTGFGPRTVVAVEEQREDLESLSLEELDARIDNLRQRAQAVMSRGKEVNEAAPGVH